MFKRGCGEHSWIQTRMSDEVWAVVQVIPEVLGEAEVREMTDLGAQLCTQEHGHAGAGSSEGEL